MTVQTKKEFLETWEDWVIQLMSLKYGRKSSGPEKI